MIQFMRGVLTIIFIAGVLLSAGGTETNFTPLVMQGQTFIHDPSPIVRDGDRFYIFATGWGIREKSSPDLIHWTNKPPAFSKRPAWITNFVPEFYGRYWAPDVVNVHGKYFLYYASSMFRKQTSAIGLATATTLDTASTNYGWTDCGPVVTSTNGSKFNAIDPSAFLDDDGKLWLAFGSFWGGIYLTELDPHTGLRATNSSLHQIAWNNSIEASCLARHGDFYYLFINWGLCCRGTNSTYEIRVGRAGKIIGPYLDRDGKDLLDSGGTKFLASRGRFIGPGQIGLLDWRGATWFSFHYYDAETEGLSRLALGRIDWSSGWPVAVNAGN